MPEPFRAIDSRQGVGGRKASWTYSEILGMDFVARALPYLASATRPCFRTISFRIPTLQSGRNKFRCDYRRRGCFVG